MCDILWNLIKLILLAESQKFVNRNFHLKLSFRTCIKKYINTWWVSIPTEPRKEFSALRKCRSTRFKITKLRYSRSTSLFLSHWACHWKEAITTSYLDRKRIDYLTSHIICPVVSKISWQTTIHPIINNKSLNF